MGSRERTVNPYAAPESTGPPSADLFSGADYLTWPPGKIVVRLILMAGFAGSCVLTWQIAVHLGMLPAQRGWDIWQAVSFAAAGVAVVFTLGMPSQPNNPERSIRRAVSASAAMIIAALLGAEFIRSHPYDEGFAFFSTFIASHIAVPAVACRTRRVPIRWPRLFLTGLLAFGIWLGVSMATIYFIVRQQRSPYDNYTGFTLLTVWWTLAVGVTTVVLMISPNQKTPPDVPRPAASA